MIDSKERFVAELYPAAVQVSRETGVSWQLLMAQSVVETEWGKAVPPGTHSLFGLVAGSDWAGARYPHQLRQYAEGGWRDVGIELRAYGSMHDALRDQVETLRADPRQQQSGLFEVGTLGDFPREAEALQRARYSTDSRYVQLLASVLGSPTMQRGIEQSAMSITDARHLANELFVEINSQLASKWRPDVPRELSAEVTLQTMEAGIISREKLLSVDVAGGNAYVRGVDGIGHAKIDLAAPARSFDELNAQIAKFSIESDEVTKSNYIQR